MTVAYKGEKEREGLEVAAVVGGVEAANALALRELIARKATGHLALVVAAGGTAESDTGKSRAVDTAGVALKLVVPVTVDTAAASLCRRQPSSLDVIVLETHQARPRCRGTRRRGRNRE